MERLRPKSGGDPLPKLKVQRAKRPVMHVFFSAFVKLIIPTNQHPTSICASVKSDGRCSGFQDWINLINNTEHMDKLFSLMKIKLTSSRQRDM